LLLLVLPIRRNINASNDTHADSSADWHDHASRFHCGPGRTMVNGVGVARTTTAKPAEPSAGVCDGKEALALGTGETPPNWRPIK